MLGNIWERTTETSVWLAVVRKWSGSFLETAHFVFWRQRYKQWQALQKQLQSQISQQTSYVQTTGRALGAILGFSVTQGSGAIRGPSIFFEHSAEQHIHILLAMWVKVEEKWDRVTDTSWSFVRPFIKPLNRNFIIEQQNNNNKFLSRK